MWQTQIHPHSPTTSNSLSFTSLSLCLFSVRISTTAHIGLLHMYVRFSVVIYFKVLMCVRLRGLESQIYSWDFHHPAGQWRISAGEGILGRRTSPSPLCPHDKRQTCKVAVRQTLHSTGGYYSPRWKGKGGTVRVHHAPPTAADGAELHHLSDLCPSNMDAQLQRLRERVESIFLNMWQKKHE